MFHGRKRSQRRELTPEELEAANTKLQKIERINKKFLENRVNKVYTEKTLELTQKIAILSPDFDTVWNYRREIITALNEQKNPQEKYKFFITELLGLVKLMKENPKSYTLWGHRQWVILEGLQIEKFMSEEQLAPVGGGILNNEIKLCDKMLTADERNFHCWNYRSWIINTQLEQYDEIEQARKMKAKLKAEKKEGEGDTETQAEEPEPYVAEDKKMEKLKEELEMTTKMIEKNFSNFSAWHYRSKLLVKVYKEPLEYIEEELEKIKHAIFTEPNDQSPWNYHRWLVSMLTPVYVTKMEYNKDQNSIDIDFSDILWQSEDFEITINGKSATFTSKTNKPESKRFTITIPEEVGSLAKETPFELSI